MEESLFIEDLKQKKQSAYKALLDEFQDKVYATCISFVPNTNDAEDIAQDVFIEVFNSIHKFKGDSKLSTWIYRITTNKSLEFIRKHKTKKRFAFLQALYSEDFSIDKTNYHTEINHPGILLEQKELNETLFLAIDKLPEAQKTAFTLSQVNGKNYQEIAAIMNKSLGSIESLLFRSRKKLQTILAHYYENEL